LLTSRGGYLLITTTNIPQDTMSTLLQFSSVTNVCDMHTSMSITQPGKTINCINTVYVMHTTCRRVWMSSKTLLWMIKYNIDMQKQQLEPEPKLALEIDQELDPELEPEINVYIINVRARLVC